MQRHFCLSAVFVLWLTLPAARASVPLGGVAAKLPLAASKLLADTARSRVYAALPAANGVAVIDPTTLQVTATVSVGSNPVDMAISPDGHTLYVANNGSTLAAVGVVDLDTLTLRTSFALPRPPVAIAAGLDGRVYVAAADVATSDVYQLDGNTGSVQATFDEASSESDLLQISSDGKTLYVATTVHDPGILRSFDVSTDTPAALQTNAQASDQAEQLVVSHGGQFLCLAAYGGNPGAVTNGTFLFSAADITNHFGTFANGEHPQSLAFSADDTLIYQDSVGSDDSFNVFDTRTFLKTQQVALPVEPDESVPNNLVSLTVDHTGSYLFIAENNYVGPSEGGFILVVTTGGGTLTPSSLLPAVTSSLEVTANENTPFTYQIAATNSPTYYDATGLPDGFGLDHATGLISGVTNGGDGTYMVQLSVSNASGIVTADLVLHVLTQDVSVYAPVITATGLPDATTGQPYAFTPAVTGAIDEYGVTGLPTGLTINAVTGLISGVPLAPGVYQVDFLATNVYGNAESMFALNVTGSAIITPVVTSASTAYATDGVPFSYQIAASNGPVSFAATGLPDGLSVDAASGLISGTLVGAGEFDLVLRATNAAGTGTSKLALYVANPTVPTVSLAVAGDGRAQYGVETAKVIFRRTGDTSAPLTVLYRVKGSAQAGVDFKPLTGQIVIPAGATQAKLKLKPLLRADDPGKRTAKIVLPLPTDDSYGVGTGNPAKVVVIAAP